MWFPNRAPRAPRSPGVERRWLYAALGCATLGAAVVFATEHALSGRWLTAIGLIAGALVGSFVGERLPLPERTDAASISPWATFVALALLVGSAGARGAWPASTQVVASLMSGAVTIALVTWVRRAKTPLV